MDFKQSHKFDRDFKLKHSGRIHLWNIETKYEAVAQRDKNFLDDRVNFVY